MEHHDAHHGHAAPHHTSSLLMYFGVFAALMVLTFLTVAASRYHEELGALSTPVAMGIAVLKATLVILFFMHVIHSTRLTWVVIAGAFLWLGILFVLTFSDYLTRHWLLY
jgi:cytochrome c oxidase subunit 4